MNASTGALRDAKPMQRVTAAEYGIPLENRIAMSEVDAQPRLEVRNGAVPSQASNTAGKRAQMLPPW